ncbi:DUF2635 domain-containing protein [Escherichia coli]|nr:DUF2635 domain-containing protein [Escherichia coli]QIV69178.1 DUF2635 domain-containing protein [Escherichia coli]QIV76282.1 DUF2635 domain-containing protein [Escherichia coli]
MTTIFIKPAPGCLIRDPDTMTPLSQDGEEKPFTPFWCRRLNDGDVIVVDKTEEPAPEGSPENLVNHYHIGIPLL